MLRYQESSDMELKGRASSKGSHPAYSFYQNSEDTWWQWWLFQGLGTRSRSMFTSSYPETSYPPMFCLQIQVFPPLKSLLIKAKSSDSGKTGKEPRLPGRPQGCQGPWNSFFPQLGNREHQHYLWKLLVTLEITACTKYVRTVMYIQLLY